MSYPNSRIQFSSVQTLDQFGHLGNMRDDSADSLLICVVGGLCGQFWHVHSLTSSIWHVLCEGVMKNSCWEAAVAHGMPESCDVPAFDVSVEVQCEPTRTLIFLCTKSLVFWQVSVEVPCEPTRTVIFLCTKSLVLIGVSRGSVWGCQ